MLIAGAVIVGQVDFKAAVRGHHVAQKVVAHFARFVRKNLDV